MTRLVVCAALLAAVAARADEPKAAPPKAEPSPAEKALFDTVKAGQARLVKLKAYSVRAEGKWQTTGGKKEVTGTNTVAVVAENPGKLRIEVGAAGEKEPHLVVACDGKSVPRPFAVAGLYSVTPSDGTPLDELQLDGITIPALRAVGVDFLARPDMASALAAQVLAVEALGDSGTGTEKRTGYRLILANGRAAVVRFAPDSLPAEIRVSYDVPVGEKKTLKHAVVTTLTWDTAAEPKADDFAVAVPPTAKKVDDLYEAVIAPDLGELVGKPAPPAEFTGLDGKPVKLADSKGKPTVVYAWATWAAPSVERMPAVGKFVGEYAGKGVEFLAVNAGDTPEAVAAFVAKTKLPGKVALDPLGTGLGKLRAQAVPAVVVIDKDGNVVSYHRGKPGTLDKVKADLDKLLR